MQLNIIFLLDQWISEQLKAFTNQHAELQNLEHNSQTKCQTPTVILISQVK